MPGLWLGRLSRRQRAWRDGALGLALAAIVAAAWYRAGGDADAVRVAAIAIFAATYLVIAIGRLPGFHIDRAGSALVGAALMLALGAVSLDETMQAIDFATIALLLGMMILVANLRLSGFFRLVNGWVVGRARHPLHLLAAVTMTSGVFSAFLLNDAICLVMTPLVIDIVRGSTATQCPICSRSLWLPISAAPRRSPATRRIS